MIENIRRDIKMLEGFRETLSLAALTSPNQDEVRREVNAQNLSEGAKTELLTLKLTEITAADRLDKSNTAAEIHELTAQSMARLTEAVDAMRPQQDVTDFANMYAVRQRWDQMQLALRESHDLTLAIREADILGLAAAREWGAPFLVSKQKRNAEPGERPRAKQREAIESAIDRRLREIGTPDVVEAIEGLSIAKKLQKQIEVWVDYHLMALTDSRRNPHEAAVAVQIIEQEHDSANRGSSLLTDEPATGVTL